MLRIIVVTLILSLFTTLPTVATTATGPSRSSLSLRIDPDFSRERLSPSVRLWYDRFWAGLQNSNQYLNATELARSNDTYNYGRALNTHITSILQVLRVTGDRRLLDEVGRLSELMRGQLRDWSVLKKGGKQPEVDGYVNWLYNHDPEYIGTDAHEMDEMLSHALVASMAYAFYINRDLDPRYAERAHFWTNYLKNQFEAKWRRRKHVPSGFPFLEKKLTHVYVQWIRYHYYMARLTGEKSYEDEALRMALIIQSQIREVPTPIGVAAMWDHGMPILGETSFGAQPCHYARYTVQAAADLTAEGFSIFGEPGYMDRIAVTLVYFVIGDGKIVDVMPFKIDGSGVPKEKIERFAISPWTMMGRWDSTGKILAVSEKIYRSVEPDPEHPRSIYIPAGMIFSLLKQP